MMSQTPGQSVATPTTTQTISPPPAPLTQVPQTQSLPSSPRLATDTSFSRPTRLGAKALPSASFDRSAFSTNPQPTQSHRILNPPSQLQPISSYSTSSVAASQKPNYNISLSNLSAAPSNTFASPPSYSAPNYTPATTITPHPMSSPPLQSSPLAMASMLTPMQPTRVVAANKPVTKDDWGDFDPLR